MDRSAATALLAEAGQLRRGVHRDLGSLWLPLLLFGALTLGGGVIVATVSGLALAIYWAIAGPLGALATGVYFAGRGHTLGVEPNRAAPIVACAALTGGAFLAYALGLRVDAGFAAATPFVVIAAGYIGFARFARELRFAAVAMGLGLSALFLGLSDLTPTTVSATLSGAYGLAFILYGLTIRRDSHSR